LAVRKNFPCGIYLPALLPVVVHLTTTLTVLISLVLKP
jgi:hypothetical protein